jgi:hypothetical protein
MARIWCAMIGWKKCSLSFVNLQPQTFRLGGCCEAVFRISNQKVQVFMMSARALGHRPICQRRHRLYTAKRVNRIRPRFHHRIKLSGVDLPRAALRWRGRDNVLDPRHLGHGDGHDRAGNQWVTPTRNIPTHRVDWNVFCPSVTPGSVSASKSVRLWRCNLAKCRTWAMARSITSAS